jgi:hypothetical protein
MDRRDALKSLAALAGATGLTVTPVTTREATEVTLMILRPKGLISQEACARLREGWVLGCVGTALEHVRTIVINDDVQVEFVRGRA